MSAGMAGGGGGGGGGAFSTLSPPGDVRSPAADAQPPFVPGVERPCRLCGQEGQVDCNTCANEPPYVPTYYCSTQHQVADFKAHMQMHQKNRASHKYVGHPQH
jgi:hypothetical protein